MSRRVSAGEPCSLLVYGLITRLEMNENRRWNTAHLCQEESIPHHAKMQDLWSNSTLFVHLCMHGKHV